jgi:sugar phosphate isomerase/epimerase
MFVVMRVGRGLNLAAALAMLAFSGVAEARAPRVYGAELYTVRAAMERDFDGTLRRVAAIGYREVEFVGLFGHDPKTVRVKLRELGLKAVGSQVDWKRLRDDPAGLIAETKALGAPYMVFAWMPPEERRTLDQWRWWIAHLNKVGNMARRAGLRFAYHSHDFEYHPIDGVRPIDLLTDGLAPGTVDFEMDLYWTTLGGGNPAAMLKAKAGRYPLAHVKDMSRTDTSMVDVGDGRIDFPTIFVAAHRRDFRHMFVEHDNSADPFRTLERSLSYLKSLAAQ